MISPTPQQPQQTPGAPQPPHLTEQTDVPQQAPASQAPQEPDPYEETRIERAIGRGFRYATGRALAPYQTAVIRIGFSATWLLFLLREWPHRAVLYGPDSPWSLDMARRLLDANHAFSVLPWSDGRGWFECVYLLAILASALLMLGWRTRTMSVLFMVGVLSLQNRSIFIGDGGDNVIHLMSMYLVLTRCGQVWSLDARRAKRAAAAAGETGEAPTGSRDLPGIILWAVLGLPWPPPSWAATTASAGSATARSRTSAGAWCSGGCGRRTVCGGRCSGTRPASRASYWTPSPSSPTTAHCW